MSENEKDARKRRLKESIEKGEAINLCDEAFATEGVAYMLRDLTEEEMAEVRRGVQTQSAGWQGLADHLVEIFSDDKVRKQFVVEAIKRYGQMK